MGKFKNQNLKFKTDEAVIFGSGDEASIGYDGTDLTVDVPIVAGEPTKDTHLTTKGAVDLVVTTASGDIVNQIPADYITDSEMTTISGDIVGQIPSLAGYLTTAQFTTSSGDIVDQIPTDYISDAEMTTISGNIVGQIPSLSGYATEVYVTTVSGDIIAQIPSVVDFVTDAEITTISGDIVAQFPTPGIANVVEDTTPQLGGNLDLNNFSISHTVSPSSNQTAVGDIATLTVDTNGVGFGCALYMASDGNFDEADADALASMPCVALALASGTGSKSLLLRGFIRDDAWTWTPGGIIYVSTTQGTLTQTAPSGNSDVVQVVGFATHADRMYFNPSYNTIVLVV